MFWNKNWTLSGVQTVLSKIDATGSVDPCSGSGRPHTARSPDTSMILFCPDLNPVDYVVWVIVQDRVYKHQWITNVEELPAC